MPEREDQTFEARLEQLFAVPSGFDDQNGFVEQMHKKVERRQNVRRFSVAAAGMLGGVLTCVQLFKTSLIQQVHQAELGTSRLANTASSALQTTLSEVHRDTVSLARLKLAEVAPQTSGLLDWASQPSLFWSVSLVMIVVVGLLAARVFDEV